MIEIIHYKDKNHWLETRGSNVICDEFGRLNEIGFE
jgi:hypothetical protein